MGDEMEITNQGQNPTQNQLKGLIEESFNYISSSRASNTLRVYKSAWENFQVFTQAHRLSHLPALEQTVVVYLTSLASDGYKVSTISLHLSAIKFFHNQHRQEFNDKSSLIAEVMNGIRRTIGVKQNGSSAISTSSIRDIVDRCSTNPVGYRNRSLLLLGFAGAFRRSELVSISIEDMELLDQGILVNIARSKTDQEGKGQSVSIAYGDDEKYCPVRSTLKWMEILNDYEGKQSCGRLFRKITKSGKIGEPLTAEGFRFILEKMVNEAGLSGKITPHSLRAGFCTEASNSGASLQDIATHARHTSVQTTMKYIRNLNNFGRGNKVL